MHTLGLLFTIALLGFGLALNLAVLMFFLVRIIRAIAPGRDLGAMQHAFSAHTQR